MQKTVTYIALTDILFILFLAISGSFAGIAGTAAYYLAYIVPFAILFFAFRESFPQGKFKPWASAEYSLLALFPFIAAVILVSFVTSELLGLFGASSTVDVSGNIFLSLFKNAFLPAVLEELLFRFAPITLLCRYSKKWAVILSALFFALAHGNFFQIPYALVAGVALGAVYLLSGSVIPCIFLHFANNALSVFMQRNPDSLPFIYGTYITVAIGACISLAIAFFKRERYFPRIKEIFSGGEKISLAPGAYIYIVLTITLSVFHFISLF